MVLEVVCAILKEKMEEFIHVIQFKVRVLSLLLHHFLYNDYFVFSVIVLNRLML